MCTMYYFLLLGNKWNFKKFVPYSELLDNISSRWPNVERISDHPNDTSKVYSTSGVPAKNILFY